MLEQHVIIRSIKFYTKLANSSSTLEKLTSLFLKVKASINSNEFEQNKIIFKKELLDIESDIIRDNL